MQFRSVLGAVACALVTLSAAAETLPAGSTTPRTLSFDDRVRAQTAIERVYYRHQIGATKLFEDAVPRAVIEAKVRKYLEESAALQVYWKTPITDESLQRELDRMAGGTRMPERLQEVYSALGNDVFLIKECVARATLADRLAHNFYAFDARFHTAARQGINALRDQLASGALSPKADHPNRSVGEIAVGAEDEVAPGPTIDLRVSQAELDRRRAQLPSAIGQASHVVEGRDAFSIQIVLSETATSVRVATYVVPKVAWDTWWGVARVSFNAASVAAVASNLQLPAPRKGATFDPAAPCTGDGWDNGSLDDSPIARFAHAAVWTGNVMVVWGGAFLNVMGQRYDPVTDTWSPIAQTGAPSPRNYFSSIWTGTEMIVWGGSLFVTDYLATGGRYDPIADRWTPTSTVGAPSPRSGHTAVWTGDRMIIWGGGGRTRLENFRYLGTGANYDPSTDTWSPLATTGAPFPRNGHTAVWTGSEMIVWGGWNGSSFPLTDGARYVPGTNQWTPISGVTNRAAHTAVWTGTYMVIWGGVEARFCNCPEEGGYVVQPVNTGFRYDPSHDRWLPISELDAPSSTLAGPPAAWTGHEMILWVNSYSNQGWRYDPAVDHWTPMSMEGAPESREYATAVWTGHHFIVWGGAVGGQAVNTGGRYDPWTDSWTPTSTGSGPSTRGGHSLAWTGNTMLVWGGRVSDPYLHMLDTGGRYDPALDAWQTTSTEGAPAARSTHLTVWSGDRMLVWGGNAYTGSDTFFNDGGRYDPIADAWEPMSNENAPSPRVNATAVWTGSSMLVWGGSMFSNYVTTYLDTGARYDPSSDTWTPTSPADAPSGRELHTAVWTGGRMVVWAGVSDLGLLNSGGRYDPGTDAWTPTAMTGAPVARRNHSAAWMTGRMIVWGGSVGAVSGGAGARYDPEGDVWGPIATVGAPPNHLGHQAVVAGDRMLIWGGNTGGSNLPLTHGYYDPMNDRWTKIPTASTPNVAAGPAVWTGEAVIVWNGIAGGRFYFGSSPGTDCDGDGVSAAAGDCDDRDVRVFPGAVQACDGVNDDCNNLGWPLVASTELDGDQDGVQGCQGDCDDTDSNSYPGAPELCDGRDNDCDGFAPNETDNDRDGYRICQGDCDDSRSNVRPGGTDYCNGLDDNCNGTVDDGGDALCNNPNYPCFVGACQGAAGCVVTTPDLPCDDDNPCTANDHCTSGSCSGTPPADGISCQYDHPCFGPGTCSHGLCSFFTYNDGAPCDDGVRCTIGDMCLEGYCSAGAIRSCSDGDDCNGREYCDYSTGECATFDVLGGCDDGNICTTDSCDPVTGCSHVFNSDPCDDGNACTAGDVCTDGLCQAGEAASCYDGNPCTDDACLPWAGCTHTNHEGGCDDGNACTRWDACENGACAGHDPVVCAAADACHEAGSCDPSTGTCAGGAKPDGTTCDDGDLCSRGDTCQSGACVGASSGLNEPNPRSSGYYKRLCIGPHSGDQLTDADAACVATVASTFSGISTVADLCAELQPSQPNNDACDRADDDLMALALNICRARVCTSQGIDSHCGANDNVGQSLAEADAILSDPPRSAAACAQAKCLAEEINTGRALEMNTLALRREGGGVRLSWQVPYLEDGTGGPSKYHVWRRVRGSLSAFTKIGTTADTTFLDTGAGAFEYEVTGVMN